MTGLSPDGVSYLYAGTPSTAPPVMVRSRMGYLLAIFAATLWGFAYALDHKLVQVLPLTTIMTVSTAINLVVLVPVLVYRGEAAGLPAISGTTVGQLVLATAALLVASFCTLESIRLIGAARASSLEIAYPLFTTLFLVLLFKETTSWWTLLGALLILAGSVVIVWKS